MRVHPVFINGTFLSRPVTGVERYAFEIVRALDEEGPSGYVLLAPRSSEEHGWPEPLQLRHIAVKHVGRLTGKLWEQIELPFYARGGILFSPFPAAPLLKRKQVVTIHDAVLWVYPESYSFTFRAWYKFFIPALAAAAEKVLTVSRFSRNELRKHCHIPEAKIEAVPNGYEHITRMVADRSILTRIGIKKRFVLAVGSRNPSKNLAGVVKAFGQLKDLDIDLIIAGEPNSRVFSGFRADGAARWTGRVNDEELKALYEAASCFVHASFYEGFGLPPLEALACGCPVVSSNAASLPEILGDAALYCDPSNPVDIANKIRLALSDGYQPTEVQATLQRFQWKRSAARLKEILDTLREHRGEARSAARRTSPAQKGA